MLAGFSSLLRNNNPSLQFSNPNHFQFQDQMNAQPFNLPCNFSNRLVPKTSIPLDKPANANPSSCSFRKNPIPSSSSIATESNSLGGGRRLKRSHQCNLFDEQLPVSSKRKKECTTSTQFSGSEEDEHLHFIPNANILQPHFSSENEVENGLQVKGESSQEEQEGLELVELLTGCVDSIGSSDHHTAANYYLTRLGEVASPIGSPIQRVAAYFTEALAIRVAKTWPSIFSIAPHMVDDDDDDAIALGLLNCVSPIPRFIHFTLNDRLLRATEGKERIHIIDLDIKQGLQWPSLFQSFASRSTPPTYIMITGIGNYERDLHDTGNRLASIANALDLPFEFHKVIEPLEDVRLWMLHIKENEFVVVNCIFQLHKAIESQSALTGLLGLIKSTNPSMVLVAEEEAEHNEPRWENRFANALRYYSAIFDSVNYSLPELSSRVRVKIEEMFGRKIRNILGYEGAERVERHEGFDRWRRIMEDGGFQCIGLGEREEVQSRLLLRMYSCEDCYSVVKKQAGGGEAGDCGGLTIKWLDQPLFTVSTWASKSQIGWYT